MKIKKLLKDIPGLQIKGKDVDITGICANSKLVAPGNLFIAKKGLSSDGAQYIPDAIASGAVAILTDFYNPFLKDVTQVIHLDVSSIEGLLAATYYQFPSQELFTVGLTGTNGKTTTSFLVKHLLDKLAGRSGLIGTIEYIIGDHRYQATRTTPDVVANHKMLREMVSQNCRCAVMEVTSHALDQGRVEHIEYDVAIFTNLSLDHLDYHHSMENYCLTKSKLFKSLKPNKNAKNGKPSIKTAVINCDSPWSLQMVEGCPASILTYGINNPEADLLASNIQLTSTGTSFNACYQGKKVLVQSPLVGRFNVYNTLAAIGVLLSRQIELETIVDAVKTFKSVSGRLEIVPNPLGLKIYVDFAHSDDALLNVLGCLNEFKQGRMITVFGCGGDREVTKRPKMAQASEQLSDYTIVTSDNPRSEDPAAIAKQIVAGFNKDAHMVELDRHAAIAHAIDIATCDDIILIAGKGHEPYQIFAHKIVEFDDRKVAAQICQKKHSKVGR
jgi:UDP-N-acetylmuramoyl-L-alanyl-D-glutamate--2,6-diaminopimelate ligase